MKVVTIGIPIYRRLDYLPNALKVVASQDYPCIDLLVSDNGMNGTAVREIIDKCYFKPYRLRQNPATVSISRHYNQLIHEAVGEYIIILADDDELSSNYVSELMQLLERHPEASAGLGMEEVIDLEGKVLRRSTRAVPETLSCEDFIRTTWHTHQYGYGSLCTFLAKKQDLIDCGGFPDIWAATGDEDLLMVKLSLDRAIAFTPHCSFRKRQYEASLGLAIELKDLERGIREFLADLDSDPRIRKYASSNPARWAELRGCLVENKWRTYYLRWADMYKRRLPFWKWLPAAFALPPRYFGRVATTLTSAVLGPVLVQLKRVSPQAYNLYRTVRSRVTGEAPQ